ncbi:MAG: polysaccharide deacetylase family protein [Clostridia bacterium]|nr:polysaccharide deacetylase family protein [Clostridia bacterium]
MKIFVMDKYSIFTFVLIAVLAVVALPLSIENVLEATTSPKILPIYSVERSDNKVALTFNCAWEDGDIDSILATLKNHNCKCTFFLVGTWAQKYPEAVKKIHADGHELASHSYNHTMYTQLSDAEIVADMDKCDSAIKEVIDKELKLVRVPSGDYNNSVVNTVRQSGRECIQWDVDSLDWKGLSEAQMPKRIMSRVKSGSIILMHTGAKNAAAALENIINNLEEKGFTFSTVGNLIFPSSDKIDHTGRQLQ